MSTPRFHGWRMAAAAAGLQFMLAALLMQSFGAYVAVLADDRGWSKTALSGAAALQSVEAALLGPALGWLLDRFGPKAMVRTGVLIFGIGFMAFSQIQTLAGFYLTSVTMAIGSSLAGYFPLTVALIQWFERYRARALAFASMGLALGGMAVPAVAWSIQTFGWRATALGSGVLAILIGLPLATLIRRRPQDHGQTVDGLPPPAPITASTTPGASLPASRGGPEFSTRQALRTRAFWLLAIGHGLALLVVTAVNVHGITHMKEGLAYSVTDASLVIMLMTFGQIGGVGTAALMGDRFDKRRVAAGCMLAHCLGLLMLTHATHPAHLVAFALLHGMAWGLRGPMMQAIRADYFGRNAIGMIMGLSALIIAIGQICGPMVAGSLADLTGNYRMGFTVLALVAGSGALAFLLAKRPRLDKAQAS